MTKFIKNTTNENKVFNGVTILSNSFYLIPKNQEIDWSEDEDVISSIVSGEILIAKDNSNTQNITNINEAINYLKGNLPSKIIDSGIPDADGHRARFIGSHNDSILPNIIKDIDYQIPQLQYNGVNKDSYMTGVMYYASNSTLGDTATFQIVDKDNILGYGANLVLDEFSTNWYIVPNQRDIITLYKAKLVPGLYIRIKYNNTSLLNTVKFICNIFRHLDTK